MPAMLMNIIIVIPVTVVESIFMGPRMDNLFEVDYTVSLEMFG